MGFRNIDGKVTRSWPLTTERLGFEVWYNFITDQTWYYKTCRIIYKWEIPSATQHFDMKVTDLCHIWSQFCCLDSDVSTEPITWISNKFKVVFKRCPTWLMCPICLSTTVIAGLCWVVQSDYLNCMCMLHHHLLAVTIFWERDFKIQSIKAFFAAFFFILLHPLALY